MSRDRGMDEQDREEQRAEQIRLTGKRAEFASIKAELKSQPEFLDPEYVVDYAYNHCDEVMEVEKAKRPIYQKWLDDPDFKAGKLTASESEKCRIESIAAAKIHLVGIAGGLTRASRTAKEGKDVEHMKRASELVMTLEEYRNKQHRDEVVLSACERKFHNTLRVALTDRDPFEDLPNQEAALSSTLKENPGAFEPADGIVFLQAAVLWRLAEVFHHSAVARVTGEQVAQAGNEEREILRGTKERVGSKAALLCEQAEIIALRMIRGVIEDTVELFETISWPKEFPDFPVTEWAKQYSKRLGTHRRVQEFEQLLSS